MTANQERKAQLKYSVRFVFLFCGSLGLLLLTACAGREPEPVAVLQAVPLPSGWQAIELSRIQLALPAEWLVIGADEFNQGAAVTELTAQNPELEGLLEQAQAEVSAGSLELVAVDLTSSPDAAGYPGSVRVGRQIYDAAVSLDAVGDANESELRSTPAFTDVARDPVQIGEQPAVRLRSKMALNDAQGNPLALAFEQYVLVSGSEVVVLTFAASNQRAEAYRTTWDGVLGTLRIKVEQ